MKNSLYSSVQVVVEKGNKIARKDKTRTKSVVDMQNRQSLILSFGSLMFAHSFQRIDSSDIKIGSCQFFTLGHRFLYELSKEFRYFQDKIGRPATRSACDHRFVAWVVDVFLYGTVRKIFFVITLSLELQLIRF